MAIKILAGIAKDGTNDGARVAAAVALLDRGWGKPPQAHTGEDGEGTVCVTIRHILDGKDVPLKPPQLEHQPLAQIDAAQSDDEP